MCCSCWNLVILGHFWPFFSNYNIFLTQNDQNPEIFFLWIFLIMFAYNLAKFQVARSFRSKLLFFYVKCWNRPFKVSGPIFSKKFKVFTPLPQLQCWKRVSKLIFSVLDSLFQSCVLEKSMFIVRICDNSIVIGGRGLSLKSLFGHIFQK